MREHLRAATAWLGERPRGLVVLVGALALLVLRPPVCPLLGNTVSLVELVRERSALRDRVRAGAEANGKLKAEFMAIARRDPFLMERLSREAGLLKPREFDYTSVAEALAAKPARALAPCQSPRPAGTIGPAKIPAPR